MDMYNILSKLDAVEKKTLTESTQPVAEISDAEFDADALAKHKSRLKREKTRMGMSMPKPEGGARKSAVPAAARAARGEEPLLLKDLDEAADKEIDYNSLEVDGIDYRDAPEFSDAYFSDGYYTDGTPLSDRDLEELSSDGDLLYQHVTDMLYEDDSLKDLDEAADKEIDYNSLEVDGIDYRDAPEFSDAYFSDGYYTDGTPLSDRDLEELSTDGDLLYQHVTDMLYEQDEGNAFVTAKKAPAKKAAVKKTDAKGAMNNMFGGGAKDLTKNLTVKKKDEKIKEDPNEGNEFSGALAKARVAGDKEFKVGGKTHQVKEGAKPDFLDLDGDGDTKESMKKAAADKKKGAGSKATGSSGLTAGQKKLPPGLQKAIAKKKTVKESVESKRVVDINNEGKITAWLRKSAGLPVDAPVYFDDSDLVWGSETIVDRALVNRQLTLGNLLKALKAAVAKNPTGDDLDGDGDTKESMKKAATDKKKAKLGEGEIHDEADHWTQEFIKMGMDPKEAEDKAWDLLWRRLKRERGIDDDDDSEQLSELSPATLDSYRKKTDKSAYMSVDSTLSGKEKDDAQRKDRNQRVGRGRATNKLLAKDLENASFESKKPYKKHPIEEGYTDFFDKKMAYQKIGATVDGSDSDYTVTFRDGKRKRYVEKDGRRRVMTLAPVERQDDVDDDGNVVKRGRGRPVGTKRSLGAKGPTGSSKLMREDEPVSEASDYMNDLVKFAKVVQSAQNPEQLETAKKMGQNLLRKYRDVPAGKLDQIGKALGHDISRQPEREYDVEDELERKGREFKETIDPADRGEYDREGDMALNQLHQIADAAEELHSILDAEDNLPEWVQSKITKAVDYIDTARDYLKAKRSQYQTRGEEPIAEKADDKDKDELPFTPDDETMDTDEFGNPIKKKNLPKHLAKKGMRDAVDETTTAGSVATGGDKPAKPDSMYGKGIYEGYEKKFSALLNEGMTVNMSTSSEGGDSVTVTATEEDAHALTDLLQMAGMFQSSGYKTVDTEATPCSECGGADGLHESSCSHRMDEDYANEPGAVYGDMDLLLNKLSGGVNGPKKQVNPNNPGDNPLAMKDLGKKLAPSVNLEQMSEDVEKQAEQRLWDLYKRYE